MKPLVLHIDDSKLSQITFRALLEELGCGVLTVSNGEEGIRAAAEHKPDLIVVDAMMPEMNGYETSRLLRSNEATRATPILMLTGSDSAKDAEKATQAGANAYVVKPVKLESLRSHLASLIQLPTQG